MKYPTKNMSRTGKRFAALLATGALVATGAGAVAWAADPPATNTPAVTAPSRPSVDQTNARTIEADAIANGYIASATDATNKKSVLSGGAWLVDQGTSGSFSNGLTAVPDGTPVYLQWIDEDGAVSPLYKTVTHNTIDVNGDGDKTGQYAFDLRTEWKDAAGKGHTYLAKDGQYYRLWIQDFKTEQGNTATMFRQTGGFFPGSFVNSVTGNNLGQFPLIGTNMQKTAVFMYVQDSGNYMTKPTSQWVDGTATGGQTGKGSLKGTVWLETGAGDRANSATGPNYNKALGDLPAVGYKVVFSALTSEGVTAYKANVAGLPISKQADAAKTLLTDHPEYIAATVYTTTNSDGDYQLNFPAGTYNHENLYGFVMDPAGQIIQAYSAFTSPLFRAPNSNASWTPQAVPAPLASAWYNVNFAVVASTQVSLDVTNYDVTDNPATNGDTAKLKVTGTTLSPLFNKIEWVDSNGKVLATCDNNGAGLKTLAQADACTFTVPDDVADKTVITARLVAGDNIVAADSFIVLKDTDKDGDPDVTDPDDNNDGTADNPAATADQQHLTQGVKVDGVVVDSNGDNSDGGAELPEALRNLVVTLTAKSDMTYTDTSGNTVKVPAGTKYISGDASSWRGANGYPLVQNFKGATFPKGDYDVTISGVDANSGYKVDTKTSQLVDGGTITVTGNTPNLFVNYLSPTDADEHNPSYKDGSGIPGAKVDIDQTGDTNLPDGTKFSTDSPNVTVDPDTGKVTVTIPADAKPGTDITGTIKVTYPDTSTEDVPVKVTVVDTDANKYNPSYKDGSGVPGAKVDIDQTGDKVPDNTKFSTESPNVTVDPDTGKVTVTIPADAKPGTDITGTIKVTYPDNSTEDVPVKVTVTPANATPSFDPNGKDENGNPFVVNPSASDPNACAVAPYVVLPKDKGVTYTVTVNGKEITPDANGHYVYAYGEKVTVKATAADGYTFAKDTQTEWSWSTERAAHCTGPDWSDGTVTPGGSTTIPNKGGQVADGTTVDVEGPGKATLNPDGSITVTADGDAKDGDVIKVTVKNANGDVIDQFEVKVVKKAATANKQKTAALASTGSSAGILAGAGAIVLGLGAVLISRRRRNS